MAAIKNNKCLILFSGGQDSTTCLYWAIDKFGKENIDALNIWYGQRHAIEIHAARKIGKYIAGVAYQTFQTSIFQDIGDSALIGPGDISNAHRSDIDLPASFVPGRNIFFLTIAGAFAYKYNILNIVTGVCQTDYSGYPDCRRETVDAIEHALSLGMDKKFKIYTPLMTLTKAETVEMAKSLPGCMDALAYSHTCYEGKCPPCMKCPACQLRAKGFKDAGVKDPLIKRLKG